MMSSYVRWGTCCDFFSFDATKYEGGRGYCRCSRELSLCLMQKVRKKFAGVQKCPYLCSEKKNKSTNNSKIYHYDRNRILRHDHLRFHRTETRNHVHGASLRFDDY